MKKHLKKVITRFVGQARWEQVPFAVATLSISALVFVSLHQRLGPVVAAAGALPILIVGWRSCLRVVERTAALSQANQWLRRQLAERHGGSITARSTPGQGATFVDKTWRTHSDSDGRRRSGR
ncbi:MAG: hypothetical protein ACE5H9_08375, partial [Anaerolineae bacterium]